MAEIDVTTEGLYRVAFGGAVQAGGHVRQDEALERAVEIGLANIGQEVRVIQPEMRVRVVTIETPAPPTVPPTVPPTDPPPPPDPIPEPPTTPPQPGGLVFASDWSSGDKSDGGRWRIALSSDQHNVGSVVPGDEAGFPSSHALKVTPNSNQSSLRLLNETLGPLPQNSSRFYRFYFRLDHPSIGDNNNHPIETSSLAGPIAWAFRSNVLSDTTWAAQMRITGTTVYESPVLQTHAPYRVEFQLERLTGLSFRLHMRLYDAAGTLVAGNAQWRLLNGSGTLADSPTLQFAGDSGLGSMAMGLNGVSNTDWHPSMLFGYQGGVCVRTDTWCGPYVPGEAG